MDENRFDAPPPALIVVDGANVVGARPDRWWRDRAGAARRLVEAVADGLAAEGDLTVVLEGAARAGVEPGAAGVVRVVHAPASGDDEIVDLVEAAVGEDPPRTVTVVTSDRGLRRRVQGLGAHTQGARWLWRKAGATT